MDDSPQEQITDENSNHSTAPNWDSQTTLLVGVGFSILLVVLGVLFWSVIPFALATSVIAYLLNPITNFFDKRVTRKRRGWSILLTFLFIFVVIFLIFVVIVPPLVEQSINSISSLYTEAGLLITEPYEAIPVVRHPETDEVISLQNYVNIFLNEQGFDTVNEWVINTGRNLNLDRETILQIFNVGGDVTSSVLGSVFSIAGSALGLLFTSLFFITILATLLGGANTIPRTLIQITPNGYQDDAQHLLSDLGGVWDGYVRGNFTLGLIMGFAMWVLALIFGLPNPLFLAFIAFSMEFIPNIGPTISMVAAVAMALIGGSSTFPTLNPFAVAGIVAVIWIFMQQLEAIVLVPRIVGENLQLHPAIVILSVIWGSSFAGLVGVIIAPPLVASFRIILQYIYGRLTGRAAFIEHEDPPESIPERIQGFMIWLRQRGQKKKQAPDSDG